jgi:hypothetical protein
MPAGPPAPRARKKERLLPARRSANGLPAFVLTEQGKLMLSEQQVRTIIESHFRLLESIPGVDQALVEKARRGDIRAIELVYRRLGMLKDRASPNRPEMPDIPTHELYSELNRRNAAKPVYDKDGRFMGVSTTKEEIEMIDVEDLDL